mmetsp:Transcript_19934/g.42231  ORF Transcript_19934/g.42231 Transcript_19934/m.42231 type:complete len:367 (-) Transcript_19934:236-1336(-)
MCQMLLLLLLLVGVPCLGDLSLILLVPLLPEEQESVPQDGGLLEALVVHRGLHGHADRGHPVLAHGLPHLVPDLGSVLVELLAHGDLEPGLELHDVRVDVVHQKPPDARFDLLPPGLAQGARAAHAVVVHHFPEVRALRLEVNDLVRGDQEVPRLLQDHLGDVHGLVEPHGEVQGVARPAVELDGHAGRLVQVAEVARRVVRLRLEVVDDHVAQLVARSFHEGLEEVVHDGPRRGPLVGELHVQGHALRLPDVDGHDGAAPVQEGQVKHARLILVGLDDALYRHLHERVVLIVPRRLSHASAPVELRTGDHPSCPSRAGLSVPPKNELARGGAQGAQALLVRRSPRRRRRPTKATSRRLNNPAGYR